VDKSGIRDVIREMLDVEEQAQQIVSDAEKQAQDLLAKAREEADLRVEQARHQATERAHAALDDAIADAQRSRADEIRIQMEKDSRIVEAAKGNAQKAVEMVINALAPG
jgi:vacuolar-type H+-ATPase subunit H